MATRKGARRIATLLILGWASSAQLACKEGGREAGVTADAAPLDVAFDVGPASADLEPEVAIDLDAAVTGTAMIKIFDEPSQTSMIPRDLSAWTIGAWVGSDQTVFLPGKGTRDGMFVIPNVPIGPFTLQAQDNRQGVTIWISAKSIRQFDLGYDAVGPAERITGRTGSKAGTQFDFSLTNLDPWRQDDELRFESDIGHLYPFTSKTDVGTTTRLVSVPVAFPLDGPGQGHALHMTQFGYSSLAAGVQLRAARAAATTRAIASIDGQTVKVDLELKHLPVEETVRLDVRRSQFVAQPGMNVGGNLPRLTAAALRAPKGSSAAASPALALITADAGPQDVVWEVPMTIPRPSSWARSWTIELQTPITISLPGATFPILIYNEMRLWNLAEQVERSPVAPTLGLVREVTIEGHALDLEQTVPGVGERPRIVWKAPALGEPTSYGISIRRLSIAGPYASAIPIGNLIAEDTSVIVPEGWLQSGQTYLLVVVALANKMQSAAAPSRKGNPFAESISIVGRFTP